MIKISSNIYQCEECGRDNDISYNRGAETINGISYETRECYSCKFKYKLIDNNLYPISEPKIKKTTNDDLPVKSDWTSSIPYIIFGLICFGAFCFIMQAVSQRKSQTTSIDYHPSAQSSTNYTQPISSIGNFEAIASAIVVLIFIFFAFRFLKKWFIN